MNKRDKYILVFNAILVMAIIVSAYFLKDAVNREDEEKPEEVKAFFTDVDADEPYARTHTYDLAECKKWREIRNIPGMPTHFFLKRNEEIIPFVCTDAAFRRYPKGAERFYVHFFEDVIVYGVLNGGYNYHDIGISLQASHDEDAKHLHFLSSDNSHVVGWDKFAELVSAIKRCKTPVVFISASPDVSMERLWNPLKGIFEQVPLMNRVGLGMVYINVCSNHTQAIPASVKTEAYDKLDALITRLAHEPITRELAVELFDAEQKHSKEFMYILLHKGVDFFANVFKEGCVYFHEE